MTKYLAQLNTIIQEKRSPHQVPKVPKAPSGTFGTSEDSRLSPIPGIEVRLRAATEAAEEAEFRAELKLLREANAKVYANPTPWNRK
jgi:hypothetical protein